LSNLSDREMEEQWGMDHDSAPEILDLYGDLNLIMIPVDGEE